MTQSSGVADPRITLDDYIWNATAIHFTLQKLGDAQVSRYLGLEVGGPAT